MTKQKLRAALWTWMFEQKDAGWSWEEIWNAVDEGAKEVLGEYWKKGKPNE